MSGNMEFDSVSTTGSGNSVELPIANLVGFENALKRAHEEAYPDTAPSKRSKPTAAPYRRRTRGSDPATEQAILVALQQQQRPKFKRKRTPTSKHQENADMKLTKADLINRLNHYRALCVRFALE